MFKGDIIEVEDFHHSIREDVLIRNKRIMSEWTFSEKNCELRNIPDQRPSTGAVVFG